MGGGDGGTNTSVWTKDLLIVLVDLESFEFIACQNTPAISLSVGIDNFLFLSSVSTNGETKIIKFAIMLVTSFDHIL